MPRYNKDAVKSVVTLSRVIADLTDEQPIRRERDVLVRCPFHDDTHPSLRIDDEKNGGVWRCDPCAKGGDVFRFVMEHESLTFPEAVDFLGERYGIEPDTRPAPSSRRSQLPTGSWIYHRPDGSEAFKVERFEAGNGK